MDIAYVRNTFPKNSETFILEEILYLKRAGHHIRIFSKWCDLSNINEKVLDNDLLSQVVYNRDTKTSFSKVCAAVGNFLRRWLKSRKYRQAFRYNFFEGRDLSSEVASVVKLRCKNMATISSLRFRLATSTEIWLMAIKFHNLSVARQQIVIRAQEFRPQHMHCPFLFAPDAIKLKQLNAAFPDVPYTVTLRSRDVYLNTNDQKYLKLRNWLITHATRVFTISNYNKRELSDKFKINGEMDVIHSSIDTDLFTRDPTVVRQPNQLISIARLVPKKGLELLIEACGILKSARHEFHLSIVGDGALKPMLLNKIKELGLEAHVQIIGPFRQNRIKELLDAAEIFVLPCLVAQDGDRDMLPNSIKEAMAMNLVAITTNISGIEELIQDGVNGMLARPHDTQDLAEKIITAISDRALARKIAAAARAGVLEHFSIKSEGEKFNAKLVEIHMDAER